MWRSDGSTGSWAASKSRAWARALPIHSMALAMLVLLARMAGAQEVASTRRILVSIPDRKLALIEDGQLVRVYPVAVGAEVSQSPDGEFTVVNRVVNPAYYHPHKVIPPGPENPLGTRWIGLSREHYGIHGTNEPWSIGKAASHGCIRMARRDLEELFSLVRVGDTVEIRGERDSEVAQIFGGAVDAPATAAMVAPVAGGGSR